MSCNVSFKLYIDKTELKFREVTSANLKIKYLSLLKQPKNFKGYFEINFTQTQVNFKSNPVSKGIYHKKNLNGAMLSLLPFPL